MKAMQLQFQALYPKSKHFPNLEDMTLKFKHFQGFPAPVRTLYTLGHSYFVSDHKIWRLAYDAISYLMTVIDLGAWSGGAYSRH